MARVKLHIPTKLLFTTTLTVRITDINYGNHLGNNAVVGLLHEARMQWLNSLGYTELSVAGNALIMGDLAVEFKQQAYYADVINVQIFVGDCTAKTFELYYTLTANTNIGTALIAQAKTGMVCYDYVAKRVMSIPQKLNSILNTII